MITTEYELQYKKEIVSLILDFIKMGESKNLDSREEEMLNKLGIKDLNFSDEDISLLNMIYETGNASFEDILTILAK